MMDSKCVSKKRFEALIISSSASPLISSRRNPLVRRLRSLSTKEGREKHSLLLLEGTHLLEEALRTSVLPVEIVATRPWLDKHLGILKSVPNKIAITEVTHKVLEAALTTKTPDGVAALLPLKALPSPNDFADFVLALDRLQDPGNLGTLFRTALAAEVEVLWLALGADPLSQKSMRASSGAVLHLPYQRIGISEHDAIEGLADKLEIAISRGHQVLGTFRPEAIKKDLILPYWDIDWTKPTVLVLGNEGSGLHPRIKACCTHRITLPHSSLVDSLNVASAAVPLLLERRRAKMSSEQN